SLNRAPEAAIPETQIFHPFQRRDQNLGHSAVGSGRTTAWTGTTALSPKLPLIQIVASKQKLQKKTFATGATSRSEIPLMTLQRHWNNRVSDPLAGLFAKIGREP
ncbi:hypothetical protein, partial [Shimia sp.]|uniref:hypothetical protein n=1 Tax=Shimia sp. TaxID=1954381 RepID=UPI003299F0BE